MNVSTEDFLCVPPLMKKGIIWFSDTNLNDKNSLWNDKERYYSGAFMRTTFYGKRICNEVNLIIQNFWNTVVVVVVKDFYNVPPLME